MATYIFEVENLGQLSRVVDNLKILDNELGILEQKELNPFESNFLIKVEMQATYEDVLKNLAGVKNGCRAQETVRPVQ